MTTADVSFWRKAERGRPIAAREGLDAATRVVEAGTGEAELCPLAPMRAASSYPRGVAA
jgi:hypothetical protein